MLPPYQFLKQCGGVLLAASLSRLDSYSADNGLWLSSWTCAASTEGNPIGSSLPPDEYDSEPPPKKRRLSNPHNAGEAVSGEIIGYRSKKRVAAVGKQEGPAIIALASTKSGDHVIAVTGEDKSIRVFEHDGRGQLQQVSQRVMPKRPCAIALTTDGTTIVCADKFGDVYSIPLLFSDSPAGPKVHEELAEMAGIAKKPSKPFVPAANDLTVHSIRNRRALQNQMKQKNIGSQKSEAQFERKLLLGHVSMLTDIALVERNGRNYIVTADRDEHIRISRGIPQAYIIEGYCLGHKYFISRLCLPTGQPDLLISGGGDDEIFVWDWSLGKMLHKISLRGHVEKVITVDHHGSYTGAESVRNDTLPFHSVRLAVSNIQHIVEQSDQLNNTVMVTCEGIPAVFIFSLLEDCTLSHYQTLTLEGNPLCLAVNNETNIMTVSVDLAHEAGSITRLRNEEAPVTQPLQSFQKFNREWVKRPFQFNLGSTTTSLTTNGNQDDRKNLAHLLYPIQKLRKIGGED